MYRTRIESLHRNPHFSNSKMNYTIDNITALIGAHRYGSTDANIEWLLTDSRSLVFPETTLFFTLRNDFMRKS